MAGGGMEEVFLPGLSVRKMMPEVRAAIGIRRQLSFLSDNRFIAGFPLH